MTGGKIATCTLKKRETFSGSYLAYKDFISKIVVLFVSLVICHLSRIFVYLHSICFEQDVISKGKKVNLLHFNFNGK